MGSITNTSSHLRDLVPFTECRLPNPETKTSRSAKIVFEKIVLTKDQKPTGDLHGSVALTRDDRHKGWLHILIYIGQLLNSIFTGKKRDNINLCHGQVILGVNSSQNKEGQLILAHGLFDGVKTTSEDHQKDQVITAVNIYRPVDKKIRDLFTKFAEQTAVNFKKEGLSDPKSPDYKSRIKEKVGPFSLKNMILSFFHKQVLKPFEYQQKYAALSAADLLKGDKFRDENGNLASFYCTNYLMTLTQATSLISALTDREQIELKDKSREEIGNHLQQRIQKRDEGDFLATTYWENDFMQADARHTMTYFAGDLFDQASCSGRTSD